MDQSTLEKTNILITAYEELFKDFQLKKQMKVEQEQKEQTQQNNIQLQYQNFVEQILSNSSQIQKQIEVLTKNMDLIRSNQIDTQDSLKNVKGIVNDNLLKYNEMHSAFQKLSTYILTEYQKIIQAQKTILQNQSIFQHLATKDELSMIFNDTQLEIKNYMLKQIDEFQEIKNEAKRIVEEQKQQRKQMKEVQEAQKITEEAVKTNTQQITYLQNVANNNSQLINSQEKEWKEITNKFNDLSSFVKQNQQEIKSTQVIVDDAITKLANYSINTTNDINLLQQQLKNKFSEVVTQQQIDSLTNQLNTWAEKNDKDTRATKRQLNKVEQINKDFAKDIKQKFNTFSEIKNEQIDANLFDINQQVQKQLSNMQKDSLVLSEQLKTLRKFKNDITNQQLKLKVLQSFVNTLAERVGILNDMSAQPPKRFKTSDVSQENVTEPDDEANFLLPRQKMSQIEQYGLGVKHTDDTFIYGLLFLSAIVAGSYVYKFAKDKIQKKRNE